MFTKTADEITPQNEIKPIDEDFYPMFISACQRIERPTIVLFGIPFYLSSGKNSGASGTWFPYRGIRNDKWLMKPVELDLPDTVIDFYESLNSNLLLVRFGSLTCLCLSAGFETGFWRTDKGELFKNFLVQNYPSYFLFPDLLKKIKDQVKNTTLEIVKDLNAVNRNLLNMGSIIMPNVASSRLPRTSEEGFISMIQSPLMFSAFMQILTTKRIIDDKLFATLSRLEIDTAIFECIIRQNVFEDEIQIDQLLGLLARYKEIGDISTQSLTELNLLNKLNTTQLKLLNNDILNFPDHRKVIRRLIRNDLISNEMISLINTLASYDFLQRSASLLLNENTRFLLLELNNVGKLNKVAFNLIDQLYDQGLVEIVLNRIEKGKRPAFYNTQSQLVDEFYITYMLALNKTSIFFDEIASPDPMPLGSRKKLRS